MASLSGRSVLSVQDFSRTDLETIFSVADAAKRVVESSGSCEACKGKVLANAFYEPSTRTSSSFVAAMERLGGSVIAINEVRYSSVSSTKAVPIATPGDALIPCRSIMSGRRHLARRHPGRGGALG